MKWNFYESVTLKLDQNCESPLENFMKLSGHKSYVKWYEVYDIWQ